MDVILPGRRVIAGHLHSRRQDADGRWWYEVSIDVPVRAVQPVKGEDYSQVPTGRPGGPEWVLQALRHDTAERRAVVLHVPECWAADGRLMPATEAQAAIFIREGWATACDVCKPAPTQPSLGHQPED